MNASAEERALLRRIHAGDQAACDECFVAHLPGVSRLARRLVGNEGDAEDLTQETFLHAFKAIDSFEGRSSISTWLYRIAYNLALMRRRGDHSAHGAENTAISVDEALQEETGARIPEQLWGRCCLPEDDFDTEEMRAQLEAAVRGLPEPLRAVYVLRDLEGLNTHITAETLDISIDLVKQRLHRARQILRSRLADYSDYSAP